jgi:hypothetical protein
MKRLAAMVTTAALVFSLSASSVFAFTDLDDSEKAPILQLKDRGVVSGVDTEHFAPKGKINMAQSVSLIVKGLGLNIDNIRFVKEPQASDYFTNVPNDAWYAKDFIIAHLNGLELAKDIDPNAIITREQYANLLVTAMETKGQFPLIKMLILFEDDAEINPLYQGTLQRLYLYKIAKLGEDRKAEPKREVTRGEAAVLLYNAIQFVESHKGNQPAPEQPGQNEVTVKVEQVNADVNKVTLSRTVPHPGYGLAITGIRFQTDGTAVITYAVTPPKPDMMYPQVVTEVKAETYVSAQYKPVAEPAAVTLPGTVSPEQPVILPVSE